ncbi:LamG domain-containing protein [Candidatus Poribacteria bacterium]|jgi:hypothetical protein|nr:LamG domain-containing protein [Candidatus Poribacteria bacterium]MBT5534315.1 LamG domain-containing protein [Candidatus Poribacteria bacterium]MBT5710045.1 LamG domain-containing protein [Candidatus Poribacteria bacterium]MBT7100315.1 LamG domain-containing protein [Candidatus Poribacteria bacterium]MBT7808772.1 LamG domain-containing protein [Candidatus Poribacteria bacterium]
MRYRFLLCGSLALMTAVATTGWTVDADAVGGVWQFDDLAGDAIVDSSGNGNDGTLVNGPEWVDGKFGTALEFSQTTGSYALVPVQHSNTATVTMWAMYTATPSTNIGLIHAQATDGDLGGAETKMIGVWVENTNLLWGRIIDPAGARVNLPKNATLEADTWFHIALVVDAAAGVVTQWVNGEQVGDSAYAGELGEYSYLKIGRQGTESWEGRMDDVGYFTEALSSDDLAAIYNLGLQSVTVAVEPRGKAATTWAGIKGDARADAAMGNHSDR